MVCVNLLVFLINVFAAESSLITVVDNLHQNPSLTRFMETPYL